jgi:hypothetical protein
MLTRQGLDAEQLELLAAVIARSEQPLELWAKVHARNAFGDLGWSEPGHSLHDLSESLADLGLIERQAMMGGNVWVRPTYLPWGSARHPASQHRVAVTDRGDVGGVGDGHHRVQGAGRARHEKINAEFAHDVISLANTKASGRDRYLVVGFSNRTRELATPVDGSVEQNRLEQILNECSDPAPQIRYFTVEHPSGKGAIGVIEVRRDATKLPHSMRREAARSQPRKSSYVTGPTWRSRRPTSWSPYSAKETRPERRSDRPRARRPPLVLAGGTASLTARDTQAMVRVR